MDIIDLDTEGGSTDAREVTLFKLDGVEHKVSTQPRANVALKGLSYVKKFGPELGNLMMLEDLLPPESFKALSEYNGLTPKQLGAIVDLAYKLHFGQVEADPGNS